MQQLQGTVCVPGVSWACSRTRGRNSAVLPQLHLTARAATPGAKQADKLCAQCMQGPKLSRMSSKEGSKAARACSSCQESFLRLESHRYRPQDRLVQGLCGTCARLCCRVSNAKKYSTARCAPQANSSTRSETNADARRVKPNCGRGARPTWQA